MSRDLEKMENVRGMMIRVRNGMLDDLINSEKFPALIPMKAAELTTILQGLDALEKAIAQERGAGNVYTTRGLAGS